MADGRFKAFIYYPIVLAMVLAGGIYLGSELHSGQDYFKQGDSVPSGSFKITNLLNYVAESYVDTVDIDELTDKTISGMLEQLDPHSAYIPARDLDAMNEPLNGNFDGIGVEFNILNDTIVVVAPISGGPSDKLGIRPGDRIVEIEDTLVAGVGITNKDVMTKLRGARGTTARVRIFRRGAKNLLDFDIIRDQIPIYSVDAGYMLNSTTGYIRISRFAATTFEEFTVKLRNLKSQGMTDLVLDLRGNPGGYLTAAIEIADEFLEENQMIVFTKGRARPEDSNYASGNGELRKGPLAILIDEGSASASEIVAGAMQDNDRGTIVGRRSFGKGLVQEQETLPDGSAVRLTVARYYTPTGRCIQRPYNGTQAYYEDFYHRFQDGEMYDKDSISVEGKTRFVTPGGKIVYGGGGIIPDVFVPLDTSDYSDYLNRLISSGVLREFALDMASSNRKRLEEFSSPEDFKQHFHITDSQFSDLVTRAAAKEVSADAKDVEHARHAILKQVKAFIARGQWNGEGYYPIINEDDPVIEAALKALRD